MNQLIKNKSLKFNPIKNIFSHFLPGCSSMLERRWHIPFTHDRQ